MDPAKNTTNTREQASPAKCSILKETIMAHLIATAAATTQWLGAAGGGQQLQARAAAERIIDDANRRGQRFKPSVSSCTQFRFELCCR
jgi:hypothetical protein